MHVDNVLYSSTLVLKVSQAAKALPGLKCTVHFDDDTYSSRQGAYVYWSVADTSAALHSAVSVLESYTTVDHDQSAPSSIDAAAHWLWNYVYQNK